jgi:hypothetical protein
LDFRAAADDKGMTAFLVIAVLTGAVALLCWRKIVQPLGRFLEFCDDLDREICLTPRIEVTGGAWRPDSSAREEVPARSPPPG